MSDDFASEREKIFLERAKENWELINNGKVSSTWKNKLDGEEVKILWCNPGENLGVNDE